jgi:outer membrane receptor protein involved in Fe transport
MPIRIVLFVIISFLVSLVLQSAQIKGVVKDDRKNIVPSVTVIHKNSGSSTITNLEGKFALTFPGSEGQDNVVLVFKRDGYHPREKRVSLDNRFKVLKIFFVSKEHDFQKVTVTAMNQEKEKVLVPMAEHSVSSSEIREKISENIMEALADTPGVHFIGSGGFSVTPTIRGLARRRVLVMVDGHRITSDRRAGTSATFVPPELVENIEVVRSSSSVLYGSDAIGGVINILTRPTSGPEKQDWERNTLNLNYNSNSGYLNSGVTYGANAGKWKLYSGFQYSHSRNYDAPDKTILHSGYTLFSGLLDLAYKDNNREFFLDYIAGFGTDIGKPDRSNDPDKYTIVPSQSDQILRMGYSQKNIVKNGSLELSLFFNPTTYKLEKIDNHKNTLQGSDTRAFNLGVKTYLKKSVSKKFHYQTGFEWFSRQNVRMENQNIDLTTNEGDPFFPMKNGIRNDYSLFLTFDYHGIKNIEVDGGIRYTFFSIGAEADEMQKKKNTGSYSFFLGITRKISKHLSLFINAGRAFRFPSLSESFYTGLSGRKYVVGNGNLLPEKSLNADIGLKMAANKFSMGLYFFTYQIDDMIERYKDENSIYTYDNVSRGNLFGGEIEARFKPTMNTDLFGHFFYYSGKTGGSGQNDPLNDVPAPRLVLGSKCYIDQLWMEVNFLYSFKKTRPGPAEIVNASYTLVDFKGGYYFSSTFYFYVKLANLLNSEYYANPDPDIPLAKGFNISAGLHFYF